LESNVDEYHNKVEEFYQKQYSNYQFQRIYLKQRTSHYLWVLRIIQELGSPSVLDIGCSYGFLVELCNKNGIDAYGLDLPFEEIIRFHENLSYSKGKFIYGNIGKEDFSYMINSLKIDTITMMDTFRYITKTDYINKINANYIIIKDISIALYNNWFKKGVNPLNLGRYSPQNCLEIFKEYDPYEIYTSKHIFKKRYPGRFSLHIINAISPTYSLILKRRGRHD
jgi:SAM-dependent methyltransferase